MILFPISGQAMGVIEGSELYSNPGNYDGGSPAAYAAYNALHNANRVKRFGGYSYRVMVGQEGAEMILEYCQTVGDGFAMESDPETKSDARALLVVANRIRKALAGIQ